MRPWFRRLRSDDRGGTLVEFAFAAPVIVSLVVGALQVASVLYANTVMRSALGEGARIARLWRAPVGASPWAGPTADEICQRILASSTTLANTEIESLTLTRAANGTANALLVSAEYNVDLFFVFFNTSPTLTATRQVYLRTQPNFGNPVHDCPTELTT